MGLKILSIVLVVVFAFLIYVSTRPGQFHYERSGVINASADKIFPYLNDFTKGMLWNPYDRKDPNMKRNFIGPATGAGSIMEFDGNREGGTGKLEIMKTVPNQLVEIRLLMTKPIATDNIVRYRLTPEGNGTRFSWSMDGESGFMGKLISVIMDCEKMMARDFDAGIATLKSVVESQK